METHAYVEEVERTLRKKIFRIGVDCCREYKEKTDNLNFKLNFDDLEKVIGSSEVKKFR